MRPTLSALAAAALFAASCATARPIPFPAPLPPEQSATVTVFSRHEARFGTWPVYLDGSLIAKIDPGEFVTFSAAPGTHSVGAQATALAIAMEAGQRYFFVLSQPTGFSEARVQRVTAAEATERFANSRNATPLSAADSAQIRAAGGTP